MRLGFHHRDNIIPEYRDMKIKICYLSFLISSIDAVPKLAKTVFNLYRSITKSELDLAYWGSHGTSLQRLGGGHTVLIQRGLVAVHIE